MNVKIKSHEQHLEDLRETFKILKKFDMNKPQESALGVRVRKFLGIASERGPQKQA